MTIDLHAGNLTKARGYQPKPSGGLTPVYSICEVVAVDGDRVRVVHHYPDISVGWELPSFTVSVDDILPPF